MNMAEAIELVRHPVRETKVRIAWRRFATARRRYANSVHEYGKAVDDALLSEAERDQAEMQYDGWLHGHDELDS